MKPEVYFPTTVFHVDLLTEILIARYMETTLVAQQIPYRNYHPVTSYIRMNLPMCLGKKQHSFIMYLLVQMTEKPA